MSMKFGAVKQTKQVLSGVCKKKRLDC